jgi:hypothetical protein
MSGGVLAGEGAEPPAVDRGVDEDDVLGVDEPGARPARSPAHRPKYTAVTPEVHGRQPRGTSARPGVEQRRRGSGAGPARARRQVHGRAIAGTRQGHRRSMAPGCIGAEKIRDHEELTVHPYDDPSPRTARTAPGDPHPPRLPEAVVTGPARWRLSPERSACWSPGRSRWPCRPAAWPRARRTGWYRWMS